MLRLYYKIWVSAIISAKASKAEAGSWKLFTLGPVSLLQGINLFTVFVWMKSLVNHRLPLFLPVNIFNYRLINDCISVVTTFFIPFVILNYLLIFSNNQYKDLLKKLPGKTGNYIKGTRGYH